MTIRIEVSLLGDAKLKVKIDALGKHAKKMMRKALRAGAKVIKKRAQINYRAMTGPGNDTDLLMRVAAKLQVRASKRSRVFIGVRVRLPTRAAIGYPPREKWKNYGPVHAELGTKDTPAFPGLRNAFHEGKAEARAAIVRVLWAEIKKEVARR